LAITTIHPIDTTVEKAIDYILDPEKTDNGMLVNTLGCTADGKKASREFDIVRSLGTGKTSLLAQHLVQSFAPGEVTPEQAQQIGLELCEKLLGNSYQFVIATHIDHEHIHNHIIFNEVDFLTFRSFEYQQNRGGKVFEKIQQLSDDLCREHGLGVIEDPDRGNGKKHYEWEIDKAGASWKSQLKNIIDDTITESVSFNDFLEKIRAKNVETVYRPENKITIKFRLPEQQRFARGRTLGWYYDEPQIRRRIEQYQMLKTGQVLHPKKTKLIDTSADIFQQSKGLEHWADVRNMQNTSKMLNVLADHGVESAEQLEEKSVSMYNSRIEIVGKLNALQREINDIDDTEKLIKKYIKYKPFNDSLKQSKFKKKFTAEHEKELRQYEAAKKALTEQFPDKRIPRLETLSERKKKLISQRNELNAEYKKIAAELKELDCARRTVNEYLEKAQEQKKSTTEIH